MDQSETYELYAIKYAENPRRNRSNHFIRRDFHDGPSQMDFFVWVAVSAKRTVLIDMGGTRENALHRGHDFLRCPGEGLQLLGIDAREITDVIVTHMHWDHIGNFGLFPRARVHLQWLEMQYAVGPYMQQEFLRHSFDVNEVCGLVRKLYDGMLVYHEKVSTMAPGIEIHHVGGHTMGQQIVRVQTRRGWVVLASDAAHLYENMEAPNPFPVLFNVGDSLMGYDTMRRLAHTPSHIVPGHDPLVLRRYAAPSARLSGIVAALHDDPNE